MREIGTAWKCWQTNKKSFSRKNPWCYNQNKTEDDVRDSCLSVIEIHVDITRFRYDLTKLLSEVAATGCRCIIKKNGKEYACIISIEELIKLKQENPIRINKKKKNLTIDARLNIQNIDPKKLYTYNETSKILSISLSNIRKRVVLGEINPIYVGRSVRFSGEAIKRFLKQQAAIYDIESTAQRLGLSGYAIRKLIVQGKLQASTIHGKYLITKTELDRFLNELIQ